MCLFNSVIITLSSYHNIIVYITIGNFFCFRYWLLTVLQAGENVPPKVELRLARLYKAAFARQQQRHLGLLTTDPRLRRATNKRITQHNDSKLASGESMDTVILKLPQHILIIIVINLKIFFSAQKMGQKLLRQLQVQ